MLLKRGSTGEDVKKLQAKLSLTADGIFGPGTEAKVKEYQTAHGLTADGIVGDGTWSKLFPETTTVTVATTAAPVADAGSLNISRLQGHIPAEVLSQIPDTAAKFNITTNLRLAHFLAQCAHESGNFRITSENLNYSKQGLIRIFSRYFPGNLAELYANQPEKIGSRVYGNRMGNGNEESREGYKFRGRGYIQLTGKDNYSAFARFIGEDTVANPDLVATRYPLASAAFFFNSNGLWALCDRGSDEAAVTAVTRKVNGGTIGQPERLRHFNEYWNILK